MPRRPPKFCCLDNTGPAGKDLFEAFYQERNHFLQLDRTPQDLFYGRYGPVMNPTGDNGGKVIQIRIDIQGEPMGRNPT